jgi:hypothetical protein
MNAKKTFILVCFLLLFYTPLLFGATKEILWSALTFSDTSETIESARNMGINNLALLEEVLFIKDLELDNVVAREKAYLLFQYCSLHNLLPKDEFFAISLRLLSQIDILVFPARKNAERQKFVALLGNYGIDPKTGLFMFSTQEAFSVLLSQLTSSHSIGLLSNSGVLNSLKKKLESAKKSFETGHNNAAINKLTATINEVKAQDGVHIPHELAIVFTAFCQNLINHIIR